MSLDLLSVHNQITAKLREDLAQDVYETAVPDDKKIAHGANGLFNPYVVAIYGDMTESGSGRGILSTRYNTGTSYCVIMCVAPTQMAARQVANLVRESLLGFQPTDAGELRPAGGRNYAKTESVSVPKSYVSEVAFSFTVNTVW
jgi:hypothetical protein